MFNRSFFNRATYNREFTLDVLFAATLAGEGFMSASPSVEYSVSIAMSGEGELTANFLREIAAAAAMDGDGTLTADAIRERLFASQMDGEGYLTANGSRFRVEAITVTGPFAPGEKIVIDSGRLTIRKNGANILSQMSGDFIGLNLGQNAITYTDTASGRSVLVRFTYKDKFV